MPEPFRHTLRVRYHECDAQGMVFNAHYLAFMDIAMTELWREAFGSYGTMLEQGVDMVVAEAHLRFRAAARFDELITLEVVIEHAGNTSLVSDHRINRGGERLLEATLRHVIVDRESLQKTPIPDWLRAGLVPWTTPAQGE